MLRTLELLNKSKIIESYKILDFKYGKNFYFLKIKAKIIDKSELYIREYVSEKEFLYSYHWQDEKGNLRIRWDNAPHYKNLRTYPHHKHISTNILESEETNIEDIIKFIEKKLKS